MRPIQKGLRQLYRLARRHLVEQGLGTTLLWFYGRGVPALTGVPILRYCRVTPQLFVGSQYRQMGLQHLRDHGIRAVVNMRKEFDSSQYGLAPEHYCYLPTTDDTAPSLTDVRKGSAFIQSMIDSGEKVYIHCGAGVGRAPTMAAAYLMSTGLSLEDALAAIRKVRPFIYIMPPQMDFLKRLDHNHFE